MFNDGYIHLAAAILQQAKYDYISALKHKKESRCKNLERFFLSDWGQLLSFDHGEYIIEQCKKIVEEERQAKRRHRPKNI